jgi:hypothetical protein
LCNDAKGDDAEYSSKRNLASGVLHRLGFFFCRREFVFSFVNWCFICIFFFF